MRARRHGTAGGADDSPRDFEDLMKSKTVPSFEKRNVSAAPTAVATPQPLATTPISDSNLKRRGDYNLFDDLMKVADREDIMGKLRNARGPKDKDKPDWESKLDSELGGLKEMLRRVSEKRLGNMEVFVRCPGLLSTVVQGELASSRGLNIRDCEEYSRAYMYFEDVNQEKTPYRLGDLFMDQELLRFMKKAMRFTKPDGFYFTPTQWLASDIAEIYTHVHEVCDDPKNEKTLFPQLELEDWPADCEARDYLHYTILLCNNFQHIRMHGSAYFTVGDMVVVAKASRSLPQEDDLVWAMLISPDLFKDLVRAFNRSKEEFKHHEGWAFLNTNVSCNEGVLDCTDLMKSCGISRRDDNIKYATNLPETTVLLDYKAPLCSNGTYSGLQVLASFLDVLVRYFWIEKRWITDVERYDHVIPQTIIMC